MPSLRFLEPPDSRNHRCYDPSTTFHYRFLAFIFIPYEGLPTRPHGTFSSSNMPLIIVSDPGYAETSQQENSVDKLDIKYWCKWRLMLKFEAALVWRGWLECWNVVLEYMGDMSQEMLLYSEKRNRPTARLEVRKFSRKMHKPRYLGQEIIDSLSQSAGSHTFEQELLTSDEFIEDSQ
ncbi:hypothetical protein EDB19DRAFT_1827888 [Suillus lakei]|nr:hypothetical protein EDB19DRAFT_1827888 [Suillus lakei]